MQDIQSSFHAVNLFTRDPCMSIFFARVVQSVVGCVDFIVNRSDLNLYCGKVMGLPQLSVHFRCRSKIEVHTNAVNLSCKSLNCSSCVLKLLAGLSGTSSFHSSKSLSCGNFPWNSSCCCPRFPFEIASCECFT